MFWMLFSGTRASVIQFTPALFSCGTVCAYLYSHAVTETVSNVSQYNTGWTDWKCVELDNRIFTSVLLCFILFTLVAHENFWKLKLGEVLVRVGQYPAGSFISSVTACWDLTCILAGMMVVLHKDKLGDLTTALCRCMLEPYWTKKCTRTWSKQDGLQSFKKTK